MLVKDFKDHEGGVYVPVGSLVVVGLRAHPHLDAGQREGEEETARSPAVTAGRGAEDAYLSAKALLTMAFRSSLSPI